MPFFSKSPSRQVAKPQLDDFVIPRSCVVLTYKAPYALWVRQHELRGKQPQDLKSRLIELNADKTAYLIERGEDIWNNDDVRRQVEENFQFFFEQELAQWEEDSTQWPTPLTLAMFKKWFDVEVVSMVLDVADPKKRKAVLRSVPPSSTS